MNDTTSFHGTSTQAILTSLQCSSPMSERPFTSYYSSALGSRMGYYYAMGGPALEAHGVTVSGEFQDPKDWPQDPDFPGVRPKPPPRPPKPRGPTATDRDIEWMRRLEKDIKYLEQVIFFAPTWRARAYMLTVLKRNKETLELLKQSLKDRQF